ncbi:MAG: MFS transporter [Chitinophagales bacterium]|nr:MFS transporter [Chitinophagales bacterium]
MLKSTEKIGFGSKVLFSLGQTGWSLAVFGFTELIYFFYLPPDDGKPLFKEFVFQGAVGKVFTIVGLLSALGYIVSAFMEPIVASLSDRSNFKIGKRKFFMAVSVLPFATVSALVFFPLHDGLSEMNTIWLSVTVLTAFLLKCFYTTPYNALINEVAKDEKDRFHLIMMLSVAYALGIGIGQTINICIKVFQKTMTNEHAFQWCILVYSIIAFALMSLPILFVKDGSTSQPSATVSVGFFGTLKEVWKNKNYRILVWVEFIYWFPNKIFTVAVPYFVTALMGLDNLFTSVVLYCCGIGSFILYPLIDKMVVKYGKKYVMQSAFVFLIFSNAFTATMGMISMPSLVLISCYVLLNIYPLAVLGILPMAMAGDNAEKDFKETGIAKNASYYGLKTFMMKLGVAFTSLIFPSLLLLGKSPSNPLGVRMVAIFCCFAALLAFIVMRNYKDISYLKR